MIETDKKTKTNEIEEEIIKPDELRYENRTIRGKTYKTLVNPFPYRLAKQIMSYLQDAIDPKTNLYTVGGKEISELSEIILCSLVVEPKITIKYLESDVCPMDMLSYGTYLFKKVMASEDIKSLTGLNFENEEIDEEVEITE